MACHCSRQLTIVDVRTLPVSTRSPYTCYLLGGSLVGNPARLDAVCVDDPVLRTAAPAPKELERGTVLLCSCRRWGDCAVGTALA